MSIEIEQFTQAAEDIQSRIDTAQRNIARAQSEATHHKDGNLEYETSAMLDSELLDVEALLFRRDVLFHTPGDHPDVSPAQKAAIHIDALSGTTQEGAAYSLRAFNQYDATANSFYDALEQWESHCIEVTSKLDTDIPQQADFFSGMESIYVIFGGHIVGTADMLSRPLTEYYNEMN